MRAMTPGLELMEIMNTSQAYAPHNEGQWGPSSNAMHDPYVLNCGERGNTGTEREGKNMMPKHGRSFIV